MDKYLCIHCHFYQPARENPWLEAIELQDSAYPYHDWNERVAAECYAPNAASRILDGENRIVKITNNYSRISFNFGATLLSWLEQKEPDAYQSILEADRESRERFSGHGSAIAQGYSHVILPLANQRDRQTQVLWGIRDFERRFGRKPEGMWLPETAVDTASLEVLADHGIRFTILAPNQAEAVRKIGGVRWQDVSGSRIDPTMPYRAVLPSGRDLTLFFYDGPISRAVAFEQLLENGEEFATRLKSGFSEERERPQLMHIATDGETYGHHHPHGDMALGYVLEVLDVDPSVKVTNYGEFLEKHPPTHEVRIFENSSWSCVHGVERWKSDCGCRTGGHDDWNQAWRAPLRDALDWLRDSLIPLYEAKAAEYLHDPWDARNGYIELVCDRSADSLQAFLRGHAVRELNEEEVVTVLRLLEMQRNAILMFTSCGWFFNELSGIETVQVLRYAARALQLARESLGVSLEEEFLALLEKAKSNLPEHRDGRVIYGKFAAGAVVDMARVAAHYAVASLFEQYPEESRIYSYEITREDYHALESGRSKIAVGRARVTSEITQESALLSFGILYFGDLNIAGGVREYRGETAYQILTDQMSRPFTDGDFPAVIRQLDLHFGSLTFSMKSLFRDEQRKILRLIWDSAIEDLESTYRHLYGRYRVLMRFHEDLFVPLPSVLGLTAEAALNLELQRALSEGDLNLPQIRTLLREVEKGGVTLDAPTLSYTMQQTVEGLAAALEANPEDLAMLQRLEAATELVHELPFDVKLWKVQNTYYRIHREKLAEIEARLSLNNGAGEWLASFRNLGEKLSLRAGA